MNISKPSFYKQQGAVSLVTSLALLIGITLVTLLTAKAVIVETKNTANEMRSAQALAAANAAMDYALAYFDQGGAAQTDADPYADDPTDADSYPVELDYTSASPFSLDLGGSTANFYFDNNDGVCATDPASAKAALITAQGFSDDGVGQRTITQCVGTLDLFGGNAPKQPLISKGAIGLTGNYNIINRFNNTTIWSGDSATIGMSASAATYLREQSVAFDTLTKGELEEIDTSNAYTSQPITDRNKGTGVETIDNDPRIANLSGDEFFNNFFFDQRSVLQAMATYTTLASADGQGGGIIWVDGDASMNGGTYGSSKTPAIIYINGNLSVSGTPEINGLLYVVGQIDAAGTPTVYGSVLVEGDPTVVPAGELPVVGSGTVNLVFTSYNLNQSANPIAGTTTAVPGSWRDWQ